MAGLDQNKQVLDLLKMEKRDSVVKPSLSYEVEGEHDSMFFPMDKDFNAHTYSLPDNNRENKVVKVQESSSSTLEKLQRFFEIVQRQHPESHLELQCVDGNWKVWCGACKKLLRPDKSGKAIHNIQRQHFTSSRHKKKLHLMQQAEEAAAEGQKKTAMKGGKETQNNHEVTDQAS